MLSDPNILVSISSRRSPGRHSRPVRGATWSTPSWPARGMANAGRGTGSTWRATRTPTGTWKTLRARCGSGATGSSTRSTRTCRSTASRPSSWPATCCPIRHQKGPVCKSSFNSSRKCNPWRNIWKFNFIFFFFDTFIFFLGTGYLIMKKKFLKKLI